MSTDLRGPVPPRADILGEGRPRPDFFREAKVCNFAEVFGDEDVLRLHVAVEQPSLVHEGQALEHLVHIVAEHRLCKIFLPVFHYLVKITLQKLEHEVQNVLLPNHLFQLDEIRVAQLA